MQPLLCEEDIIWAVEELTRRDLISDDGLITELGNTELTAFEEKGFTSLPEELFVPFEPITD